MPDALCEIGAHHGGCLVNHGLAGVKFWYLARMVFQSKAILVYEKDLRGDGCVVPLLVSLMLQDTLHAFFVLADTRQLRPDDAISSGAEMTASPAPFVAATAAPADQRPPNGW